ncbi:MAG: cupin domain-containing protein [Calditerrivibrio sp.]|nr:cupin domain-containing protein [Calditerrivibrio sp.]
MFIKHLNDIEKIYYNGDNIKDVVKQVAISPANGWEGNVMRIFTVKAGGFTPKHNHDWPHINYIIEGEATLHIDGKDYDVKAGVVGFIPNNVTHQFIANKGQDVKFICIVPENGEY